jgi:hypothetical protein
MSERMKKKLLTKADIEKWYQEGVADGSITTVTPISDTHSQIKGKDIFAIVPTKAWNDAWEEMADKILDKED